MAKKQHIFVQVKIVNINNQQAANYVLKNIIVISQIPTFLMNSPYRISSKNMQSTPPLNLNAAFYNKPSIITSLPSKISLTTRSKIYLKISSIKSVIHFYISITSCPPTKESRISNIENQAKRNLKFSIRSPTSYNKNNSSSRKVVYIKNKRKTYRN